MQDIIFVHPTTNYDSYGDFRSLASFTGFEIINQDQIDPNRDAVHIVTPYQGDVQAALRARPKGERRCKIALWFLERPSRDFESWVKDTLQHVDMIWFSDRAMHGLVKHIEGTHFLPMGSDERLGTPSDSNYLYDYCHMMYVYGRRDFLHKINGKIGPNGWGADRDNTLRKSRFMLNVHQDDSDFIEPLRFALCAAYGIPLITEHCTDPHPYVPNVDIKMLDYNVIVNEMSQIIKHQYGPWRDMGLRMREKATKQYRFEDNIKSLVSTF